MKADKRAEMPWWLVLMILAILFLAIMSFVSGGIIKKAMTSIGFVEKESTDKSKCLVVFDKSNDRDGDGWRDEKGCDECPDNPYKHEGPDCD